MPKQCLPPISAQSSKILLLGTLPGERSLKLQQYYAHKGNQFWKLLLELLKQPLTTDYEAKRTVLMKNSIAVWDVLQSSDREGSSDNDIKNEIPNNFTEFYSTYPLIKNVFFTSIKAEHYYDKYVKKRLDINYFILPSPSSANTWKTFEEKLKEWELILNYL